MIEVRILGAEDPETEDLEAGIRQSHDQADALRLLLAQAAEMTMGAAKADPQAGLTLVLSDDARLQQLNHQFLGIDAPTDVLSFPNSDDDPDLGTAYLGDVILSLERARAQAVEGGHRLEDELQLLVVHGVLHLLGHDHADDAEKAAMWAIQSQVLEKLGCPLRP